MIRGIFVTGTDTGVGKTVASAALVSRYGRPGAVRYWKPIQTGIEADDDTATVQWLSGCGPEGVLDAGVRLKRPLSPHLSARLSGRRITVADLIEAGRPLASSGGVIAEGAGGVLVPLNDQELMIDFMRHLQLPVVTVARSGLGTINHTLLTIEALRARGLTVAGIVLVGDRNEENELAIAQHGGVTVLGSLPRFDPLTPEALQRAAMTLDPQATLRQYFEGTGRP